MLIPFGVLSAAGAGGEVGATYELIETVVLGTTTSEVVFSSLATYASTYKHLQLRAVTRSNRAATDSTLNVRFNGVTSGYFWHSLRNGADSETSQTSMRVGYSSAASSAANSFGATVIDLSDPYSTTKNKTFRSLSGVTDSQAVLSSGSLANTSSVTSITFFDASGSFVTGSRFSLYGIRG
jgi:hypothetical protein